MAKANTGTTVKKVLLRIKRYWFFLILSILMAAVTVASSLYVPILIGNAIDYIIGPQNVEFKAITAILSEVGIVIAITALSQWIMKGNVLGGSYPSYAQDCSVQTPEMSFRYHIPYTPASPQLQRCNAYPKADSLKRPWYIFAYCLAVQ